MSAIAATLKKNVWLDRFNYRLYPNIYVFFVAGSGMKKGVPIDVARQLLNGVDATRVISGRNSIQQIISDLSKPYIVPERETIKSAHGILLSGELAAFLVKDPDALTILTDLHDTHYNEKEWKYSLRSSTARLQQPCITLLGATNEEHFDDAVPKAQIGGGFIARTFIVYSNVPGNWNSLTHEPVRKGGIEQFIPRLAQIAKLKGEIKWTESAKETYNAWYYPHAKAITEDRTGTRRRGGDQILKAAMLLSVAESDELLLQSEHIEEAIREWKQCEGAVNRVIQGAGKGQMSQPITLIIRGLLKKDNHTISRKTFLRQFWNEGLTGPEFDISIETFVQSGAVIATGSGDGLVYTLTDSVVAEYGRQEKLLGV